MISEKYAVAAGLVALAVFWLWAYRKKLPPEDIAVKSMMIMYLTAVVSLTIFPIQYEKGYRGITHTFDDIFKPIPFAVTIDMLRYATLRTKIVQIGGNLLMTVPFGVLLPLCWKDKKKRLYGGLFLLLPVLIECTQLLLDVTLGTFYRTFDVDDIILNTAGALIGFGLLKVTSRLFRRIQQKKQGSEKP